MENCLEIQALQGESIEGDAFLEFRDAVEGITIEFGEVVEKIYYVDLIAFAMQRKEELYKKLHQEGFSMEAFCEELYEFYGEYDTEKIIRFVEKLIRSPDLAYKYFEKYWKNLNPNLFSESLAQIRTLLMTGDVELVPIRRLAQQLNNETDPKRAQKLSCELETQLDALLNKNQYIVSNNYSEESLTKEILFSLGERDIITQKVGETTVIVNHFDEIVFALQKEEFERKFQKTVGVIDKERFEEDRKMFGAKGANLRMTSRIIQAVQDINYFLRNICSIPDFETIPVSVYRKWKNKECIRDELQSFYRWINKRKIMVRSSAVHSEDNENTTGAGIYESVELNGNATIDDFEKAVISVFESVSTERAEKYRAKKDIESEEMGIVLQEYISHDTDDEKGYVNTIVKQVPKLMDVVLESGFRPVLDKSIVEKRCANNSEEKSIFYYQIDRHRTDNPIIIEQLAMLSFLFEKCYGQPLQIEFILREKEDEYFYSGEKQIAILQTRFLPKNFLEPVHVEFPQRQSLFEGRALGIMNTVLDVLPNDIDNSRSEGVVIFESSRFGSLGENFSDDNFPKSGVVVVLGPSVENSGHIETLCAEKGLCLLFNSNFIS